MGSRRLRLRWVTDEPRPESADGANSGAVPYRRVTMRKVGPEDDWSAWMAAGWDLHCCGCDALLGHLFVPFSGGYILEGSSSRLDPRLVERPGPEKVTGLGLRRYGLPTRVRAGGRTPRSNRAAGTEIQVHGRFWVYCHRCNTGQAVEPAFR